MSQDMNSRIVLSTAPLPEDEHTVTLDIMSDDDPTKRGTELPQKQQREGTITLNTERNRVFFIPPAANTRGEADFSVDRTRYDLYLVILPFNLHTAPTNKYYTQVMLWIELADEQHTAFDLCPKNISAKVEVTKTYTVSPQIKFQEVEVGLGQQGTELHFDMLRPTITATGEGEHVFYWTYRGFEGQREVVAETKQVLFIVQVPRGTQTLAGTISYQIMMAQKSGLRWVSKKCEVKPYTFSWKLDQTKTFSSTPEAHNTSQPLNLHKQTPVDVSIVCALPEEIRAVIDALKIQYTSTIEDRKSALHGYPYLSATLKNRQGEDLNLHLSWLPRYGPQEMTYHLSQVLDEYQPRLAIMTGICAGYRDKVQRGDLVVAERTFTYDNGKFVIDAQGNRIHEHDTTTYQLESRVKQYLELFDDWEPLVTALERPPSPEEHRRAIRYIKAMASGTAVRADHPFADIRIPVRDTVAIDMEGAAFGMVMSRHPLIPWLIVKGVCDYADGEKDDLYHRYAARASALYALSFIQAYLNDK
jgi:nucleoside phosphorylase